MIRLARFLGEFVFPIVLFLSLAHWCIGWLPGERRISAMYDFVESHEDSLIRFVAVVRSQPGEFSRPRRLASPAPPQHDVLSDRWVVHVDANDNVYFTTYSTTFMDEGFVCRNGDAELLKAAYEPTARAVRHLYGPWWVFRG